LLWKGVVETDSFLAVQNVDLSGELDPLEARILYKPENTPAIEAARRTSLFQTFLRFSPTPLWRQTPAPELEHGTRVEVHDLRMGFTVSALLDGRNEVVQTSFSF
jgi:hypothetical protein